MEWFVRLVRDVAPSGRGFPLDRFLYQGAVRREHLYSLPGLGGGTVPDDPSTESAVLRAELIERLEAGMRAKKSAT